MKTFVLLLKKLRKTWEENLSKLQRQIYTKVRLLMYMVIG